MNNEEKEWSNKITYYLTKFLKDGVNDANMNEFLADNSMCTFGGNGWKCPFCSHGCFKVNVGMIIEQLSNSGSIDINIDDFIDLEMKLCNTHIKENETIHTKENETH